MAKRKFKRHGKAQGDAPMATPAAAGNDAAPALSAAPADAQPAPAGGAAGLAGAAPPAGAPPMMAGDAAPDMDAVKAQRRYGKSKG